ncbi:MAG: alpha/beta fold hydrolase [Gemmatimonadota bacterium]
MHLQYREYGDGAPLFCLHGGMGLDHHLFQPWLLGLAPDFRVILFDFSGHGGSVPDLAADRMSHDVWVEDIETLRRHLELDRIAVLGHSYGGYLAQEYALRHRERVSRMILANTAPVMDFTPAVMENLHARGTPAQIEAGVRAFTAPVENDARMEEVFRLLLPLYFHHWDADAGRTLLEGVRYRAEAFNAANGGELPAFDTRERLGTLDVPTLVLSGGDDWIMPEPCGGRRLAQGIPGARHVVFRQIGHFPYVEETDHFLAVVRDFLREDSP